MDIFFYGLFMDEALLKSKGLHPSSTRVAYLQDYGLRIGERATLLKAEGERAYGVIMSLNEKELDVLYGEESVADYVPEKVTVITENQKRVHVIAYNLPPEMVKGQNKQYAKSLATVAGKIGLPSEYVAEIEQSDL